MQPNAVLNYCLSAFSSWNMPVPNKIFSEVKTSSSSTLSYLSPPLPPSPPSSLLPLLPCSERRKKYHSDSKREAFRNSYNDDSNRTDHESHDVGGCLRLEFVPVCHCEFQIINQNVREGARERGRERRKVERGRGRGRGREGEEEGGRGEMGGR